MVTYEEKHSDEEEDRQDEPPKLGDVVGVGGSEVLGQVEPVDHRQAEPVEEGDSRQQDRIGVRSQPPKTQVGDHQPGAEDDGKGGEVGAELVEQDEVDLRERAQRDNVREGKQGQLCPAALAWRLLGHGSGAGDDRAHGVSGQPAGGLSPAQRSASSASRCTMSRASWRFSATIAPATWSCSNSGSSATPTVEVSTNRERSDAEQWLGGAAEHRHHLAGGTRCRRDEVLTLRPGVPADGSTDDESEQQHPHTGEEQHP